MSDWDFLYDMNDQGYSSEEIADAAGSGASPSEWEHIEKQENKAKQKYKGKGQKRIVLNKCRVVFFDLEFYVPESSRKEHGFCYNPWDKKSKFLGGSFFLANPVKDFEISELKVKNKTQSLWLWNYQSEKQVLENIYQLLEEVLNTVSNAHNGMVTPILCGIGITTSDIPILLELFKRYKILTNAEAFIFQNKFRVVDLSQLAISTFNNGSYFLYPKTKNEILKKYIDGKKFESGKIVWELYESKDYAGIEERVLDEVASTHKCYELIKSDLHKFKALEKAEKKRTKSVFEKEDNSVN